MINRKLPSGAAVRRAANREQMQTAILDTARTIVSDSGADALTIRAVATALSYSPGAIYDYFASKEDILVGLYFQGANGLGGQMERTVAALPADATAIDGLLSLARSYRAHALANRELYQLVHGGMTSLPDLPEIEHPEMETGGFGTLLRLARRGVEEGSLVALPVSLIAHAAWSAVHGFVSLELQGHITGADAPGMDIGSPELARQHRDEFFETVIRMMLVGLVAPEYREATGALLAAPTGQTVATTEITD